MAISLVAWPTVAGAAAAFVVAVAVVVRLARPGTPLLPLRVLVWASLGTTGLALAVHASGLVPLDIPRWFYLVAVLPFVGPAVAVVAGPALRARGRIVALACLPLGLLVSVLVVNQHYQYWPDVAAVLGRDHADPMLDPATALALASGHSPTTTTAAAATTGTGVRADAPPGPATVGRLVDLPIPGATSGFHARSARVWLPPAFLADPTRARPVVELIGGTPSWTSDWTRAAHLDSLADHLAQARGGDAPVLVMVDANGSAFGDTECVGPAETYLTVDVPAYMEAHFSVPDDRSAWAVAGYSEGGTCAVTLALRHPERYVAFADLAGDAHPDVGGHRHTVRDLFGGSESAFSAHDPVWLLGHRSYGDLAGWFGAGRADGSPRRRTAELAAAARRAGVAVQEYSGPGGHDFGFVGHALAQALPWLADQVRASPVTDPSAR